ncbi:MAG: thiamine pyrophosphate-dependent dehydrogenase E1 component subunit alpha [Eubacterium sp.]|nr:thiamine pyrophosphate-dependent dehydrogenase E1 component subunit alpha [Eubacterium sp.]
MKYSNEEMMAMYRTMVQGRLFDLELDRQNNQGKLSGMFHFSTNQEAIGTAVAHALKEDEPFMPSHRCRPLHLYRLDMRTFLAEQVGLKSGYSKGTASDFHLCMPEVGFVPNPSILGAGAPIACGYAFALKRKHPGKAMIQLMGDGTFNEGVVHEALNWAAIQQLPLVFLVENNGWAMNTDPRYYRASDNIADRARACGLDAVVVDGNDLMAMREVVDVALERARKESRPSLIEAETYRVKGHFNGDTGWYRDPEYHAEMMERYPDPIPRFEKVLIENGIATEEELKEITKTMKKEIRKMANEVYEESLDPANGVDIEEMLRPETMWANPMEGLQ